MCVFCPKSTISIKMMTRTSMKMKKILGNYYKESVFEFFKFILSAQLVTDKKRRQTVLQNKN